MPSIPAEAGGLLDVQGQPGVGSEFQAIQAKVNIFYKEKERSQAWWLFPVNWRQRQEEDYKFEPSLIYTANSSLAQSNPARFCLLRRRVPVQSPGDWGWRMARGSMLD